MSAMLFALNLCKLLQKFMDLDVPGVPDCDVCEHSYPQIRVSICANCRFSGHLYNSRVHEEKVRFFNSILAECEQVLQIETNMRMRFFCRLMISMISNCIERERRLVNIENRRHDLLVELTNSTGDTQLISNASRLIDVDEAAIFRRYRRSNLSRFTRFRRYVTPFTSVHIVRARQSFIDRIQEHYPDA
jgi:hypothetical protein